MIRNNIYSISRFLISRIFIFTVSFFMKIFNNNNIKFINRKLINIELPKVSTYFKEIVILAPLWPLYIVSGATFLAPPLSIYNISYNSRNLEI